VYDRTYAGKTLNFEASGGLANASLVMQDQQTDTYWSIMKGQAIAGELSGEKLVELPYGKKMSWKEWRELHPDTLVLSVNGREDDLDGYVDYFDSAQGFRGIEAKDKRLKTKEPIYAFHHRSNAYAARAKNLEDGGRFTLAEGTSVFLYRRKGSGVFDSTTAYRSEDGFEKRDNDWFEKGTGARFDAESGGFEGGDVETLEGFDTYWYNWSLNNPETTLLGDQSERAGRLRLWKNRQSSRR
jgi:hypothetical protein